MAANKSRLSACPSSACLGSHSERAGKCADSANMKNILQKCYNSQENSKVIHNFTLEPCRLPFADYSVGNKMIDNIHFVAASLEYSKPASGGVDIVRRSVDTRFDITGKNGLDRDADGC